jgi:hypothetical protein
MIHRFVINDEIERPSTLKAGIFPMSIDLPAKIMLKPTSDGLCELVLYLDDMNLTPDIVEAVHQAIEW